MKAGRHKILDPLMLQPRAGQRGLTGDYGPRGPRGKAENFLGDSGNGVAPRANKHRRTLLALLGTGAAQELVPKSPRLQRRDKPGAQKRRFAATSLSMQQKYLRLWFGKE